MLLSNVQESLDRLNSLLPLAESQRRLDAPDGPITPCAPPEPRPPAAFDIRLHDASVGAVALDREGGLAAATSTGGTFGKLEGRIGDSPLIGPGTWADDDIAISFTGTGEHIIRSGGAISIAHKVAAGTSVEQAIDEVLAEIERLGGDAGVIVVTRDGKIAMTYNSDGMKRASVSSSSTLLATTFD